MGFVLPLRCGKNNVYQTELKQKKDDYKQCEWIRTKIVSCSNDIKVRY